jgi:NCS2 family nucleobase:cation symporter-2
MESKKKKILYSAAQTPPKGPLFFSSLQHMLLVVSLGMALPVSIGRTVGLDLTLSTSLLSAALFSMGITGILQTLPNKYIGSGFQSLSASDAAALAACIMAAQIGGIPLVLGMTIFSGVLKAVLGSFTFRLRKLFPPEVTGTMIFILGISTLPTGLKYFLGTTLPEFSPTHLLVAVLTLLFMLACTLFIKPLKPYTALAGILFGFAVSTIAGVFDISSFAQLAEQPLLAFPIYKEISYSFNPQMIIPFSVVTVAAIVDNIGDYSSCQSADNPKFEKPDWKSIEGGIRGSALGTFIAGFIGGPIQSTATTNIGIARASGITSRKVAYLASAMLIIAAFFPTIGGALSLIPTPVLGAVLMFSICYIMAGGFSALATRSLDDKRIFVIFLSISFAVSTLIPGIYSFLPVKVQSVLCSPMVMGVGILLITTILGKIGAKRQTEFAIGTDTVDVKEVNVQIAQICEEWCTEKDLVQKLQISLDAIMEGFHEHNPSTRLHFKIWYDQLQIKLDVKSENTDLSEADWAEESFTTLSVSLMMLRNMFDNVKVSQVGKSVLIHVDADI